MYVLKILFDFDPKYTYTDDVFDVKLGKEKVFVFDTRKEAVAALREHMKSISETLRIFDDDIIEYWYEILDAFIKKFDTFSFGESFWEQGIHYELSKCEKREAENGLYYIEKTVKYPMDIKGLHLNQLNYDAIMELEDIE